MPVIRNAYRPGIPQPTMKAPPEPKPASLPDQARDYMRRHKLSNVKMAEHLNVATSMFGEWVAGNRNSPSIDRKVQMLVSNQWGG